MRRILDRRSSQLSAVPLVLLAICSGFLRDVSIDQVQLALRDRPWSFVLLLVGIYAAISGLFLLIFYLLSWVLFLLGRVLEGRGEPGEVRLALAWGLAPLVWSLIYRLPLAFTALSSGSSPAEPTVRLGNGHLSFAPGLMRHGCLVGFVAAVIELALTAWYVWIASATLAEAHRFSTKRGLATLLIAAAIPLVVAAAAVAAFT